MSQSYLCRYILVACAFSFAFLGTPQTSSAGPTGQICFEEGCCYIGARNSTLNCSRGTILCAKHLKGTKLVGYTFDSKPVGSIKDCPFPPKKQKPSSLQSSLAAWAKFPEKEKKIREVIERLKMESIAQSRIESARYRNCLDLEMPFTIKISPEGSTITESIKELDRLRCQSLAPTRFKIRNLMLENAKLAKDNVQMKITNNSLEQRVEKLETENKKLKMLKGVK